MSPGPAISSERLQSMLRSRADDIARQQLERVLTRFERASEEYAVGILTALPKEAAAVRAVFGEGAALASVLRQGVEFRLLNCPSKTRPGHSTKVILCQCIKMGNNSAAVAAASLLSEFPGIRNLIMVGIAGGLPAPCSRSVGPKPVIVESKDHVRVGDVVVSTSAVFQYDMLKKEAHRTINRSEAPEPSPELMSANNALEQDLQLQDYSWEAYIAEALKRIRKSRPRRDELFDAKTRVRLNHPPQTGRRAGKPFVHKGRIGSANILLKNSAIRDRLREKYGLRAVEMEGSGVADAAWNFGVGYMIVRGVCDYCDMHKNNTWQEYAAIVAAAYARAIIERTLVGV